MNKTKFIEQQPFVVYNHKVARYLAQNQYFWTEARPDKLNNSTKLVFIYKDNIEQVKNLVDKYIKEHRENKNYDESTTINRTNFN